MYYVSELMRDELEDLKEFCGYYDIEYYIEGSDSYDAFYINSTSEVALIFLNDSSDIHK